MFATSSLLHFSPLSTTSTQRQIPDQNTISQHLQDTANIMPGCLVYELPCFPLPYTRNNTKTMAKQLGYDSSCVSHGSPPWPTHVGSVPYTQVDAVSASSYRYVESDLSTCRVESVPKGGLPYLRRDHYRKFCLLL